MNKERQRIEVRPSDNGVIELRYFDRPRSNRYYCWKMTTRQVNDLLRWWQNGGSQIGKEQLPVIDLKFGQSLISMFTPTWIEVRAIGRYGQPKFEAYSLPKAVVTLLVAPQKQLERFQGRNIEKESHTCLRRSS